jgi:lipoprotein NlpI
MKHKMDVWLQAARNKSETDLWGWSIFDEYGDEVASQAKMFEDVQECRKEARWALSDWREHNI